VALNASPQTMQRRSIRHRSRCLGLRRGRAHQLGQLAVEFLLVDTLERVLQQLQEVIGGKVGHPPMMPCVTEQIAEKNDVENRGLPHRTG
jgi:hypothetical protein